MHSSAPSWLIWARAQAKSEATKPRIEELHREHAADKEALQTELMKLYKENGGTLFSSCWWWGVPGTLVGYLPMLTSALHQDLPARVAKTVVIVDCGR